MPWTNQGGPWGGGGSGGGSGGGGGGGPGPWGRGPSGPQGPGPNIDDVVRRIQELLRRFLPRGGGNGRLIAILVAVAVVLWLLTGFYRVQPEEQGVALIFGKWVATTGPGLNYNLPAPIGTVYTPKVTRVNRVEIGFQSGNEIGQPGINRDVPQESLMLTGDENVIDIQFVVFWVIKDAGHYLFNIRNPDGTVKDVAEAAMREIIGQSNFDFARTQGRAQIEQQVQALMQRVLDSYGSGIEVTGVRMTKSDPPSGAIAAFRDVQAASADKERAINEAQGYLNQITQRAQGQAQQIIKSADAYKAERINRAQGDAQRFLLIYQQYLQNKEITTRRIYLDTMENILAHVNKVLIGKGATRSGVLPYLSLDALTKGMGEKDMGETEGGAKGKTP
ncbi:MAG TPA: FtsH protease activity modulator HflK [Alphaproteobacteria bacterium]|nr:FtsH protease activity modulator HflK [Alphaproteobacteria bacterium]